MVILSLIVKRIRVKALVKDKRAAVEAFGTYVQVGLANRIVSAKLHNILFATTSCNCSYIVADIFELLFSVKSMAGDSKDSSFLKRALRGVRAVICVNVCISKLSVL